MATHELHNLVEIDDGSNAPLRLWTGTGNLIWSGNTYQGTGKVLRISAIEARAGDPDRRVQLTISAIPVALRSRFLQDYGPANVLVRWATITRSSTGPAANVLIPFYRGRLSDPTMQDGNLVIEVETLRGDIDRGRPVNWSHEDQQRRYAGDLGLEHMRSLAREGIESTWPP